MTDELQDSLRRLTDPELLAVVSAELNRRQRPATEDEQAAQAARDEDAEYYRFFPEENR